MDFCGSLSDSDFYVIKIAAKNPKEAVTISYAVSTINCQSLARTLQNPTLEALPKLPRLLRRPDIVVPATVMVRSGSLCLQSLGSYPPHPLLNLDQIVP